MVFTRSQKRGADDPPEPHQSAPDGNPGHDSNVFLTKRKKVQHSPSTSDPDELSPESSDTCSTDDMESFIENDLVDDFVDTQQQNDDVKQQKLERILNIKLKPQQIQHIVRESIKQLVKKFNADDRDFFDSDDEGPPGPRLGEDDKEANNEYEKFLTYIDSIHSGEFFERIPLEDRKKRLLSTYTPEQINLLNTELEKLNKLYKESAPSIIDVLNMNVHESVKQKLLEKVHQFSNSDVLTNEYNSNLKFLMTHINKTQDPELYQLEQDIMRVGNSEELSDDYRKKILKSKMSFENKVIAYKRLDIMERYEESDSTEFAKYKNWMDTLLAVPFGNYIEAPSIDTVSTEQAQGYIRHVRQTLDTRLSFLEKPKDQIINIVSQMIRNPKTVVNAIGLWGCKGVGKCLAKDTLVLMYDGTTKKVQDIQTNETIMGDDMTPRRVLSLANGVEEMFEIQHPRHNDSYTVNKSHILSLKLMSEKKIEYTDHEWKVTFIGPETFESSTVAFDDVRRADDFYKQIPYEFTCDIPLTVYLSLPHHVQNKFFGYKIQSRVDALSKIKVVSKGEGEYFGFEIDGNRRFVLGNLTVTHNTQIVKSIAEALGRPYRAITLGGESDAALLTGHGFTYVGSSPGRLIEILNETKCMNPVVLIDELDKVSQTHQGKEIIGTLIHLTDSTTNSKYNYDRYFAGVEFDLSKVLFVFTYNDPSQVDRILADRLFKIQVSNYTFQEKLEIANKHLIIDTLKLYNLTTTDIQLSDDAVHYIITQSKDDEGMRDIKRKFEIIISRINTLILAGDDTDIIRLKYKELRHHYKRFPVSVPKEHVDIFLCDTSSNDTEDTTPPFGMYT